MYSLDTTHPEVLDHLEALARDLVEAGFGYLKLDFTFAAGVEGRWYDAGTTPAQRVRAGFEAIRKGAGDDTVILGCGVPLANVVGVVDANRIGADVSPLWALAPSDEIVPGYLGIQPATRSAYAATVTRSFMHRQLWVNDPDCVMLRSEDTALSADAASTWGRCVGLSGGLVMVSDDLALLGPDARRRLEEIVDLGRGSDEQARAGHPALCPDLLEHRVPTTLTTKHHELVTEPDAGTSVLRGR
jgi:alpha-galactosidase